MTGSWKSASWPIMGKPMSLDYLLSRDLPWLLKRPHLTLIHWTQVSDLCRLGYLVTWALAQETIRGSLQNSLNCSWETVKALFFEREPRLTCDWLWTQVHFDNLWKVKHAYQSLACETAIDIENPWEVFPVLKKRSQKGKQNAHRLKIWVNFFLWNAFMKNVRMLFCHI